MHEFYWILNMPTEYYFEISTFIQSQNQQQPIVLSQQLFQQSSQPECSPL